MYYKNVRRFLMTVISEVLLDRFLFFFPIEITRCVNEPSKEKSPKK
jgi:hypothetical protein